MNWIKASEKLPSELGSFNIKVDGELVEWGKYEDTTWGENVFKFRTNNGSISLYEENFHRIEWEEPSAKPVREETVSNNTHKDVEGLVKEIYHDWGWGEDKDFIKDIAEKEAGDFAIQFHDNVGRRIRNEYGFWKRDTDLYNNLVSLGMSDPDEMSHYVFLKLYEYGKMINNR